MATNQDLTEKVEGSLDKNYKRYNTKSSILQDAVSAFGIIIPHIQEKYSQIEFGSYAEPNKDSEGNLYVVGSYEGKFLWLFPETKFITILWGETPYGSNADIQKFCPKVRFGSYPTYEFIGLDYLDELCENELKIPKN
jgi:hypothetical protein